MQLVDFATARAGERAEQERREWRARAIADGHTDAEVRQAAAPAQLLLLRGENPSVLVFEGDAAVYGWSSGFGNPPDAIEASLMALEQYFYLRLDAEDDIAAEISAVLARSRSVAILGVLCDIGKRQMRLFDGALRPLLSAPDLYDWEINKLVRGRSHLMIGAFMRGQEFTKLAQQFHALEHRKRDLRHVAMERLLNSKEMQSFFGTVRDWWKQRQTDGEKLIEMVEQLELWLNPANYEMRKDPKRGPFIVNFALERVQAERADEHQELNNWMLVTGFPIRCRTILDEWKVQTDAQLDEIWQTWARIRELAKLGTALPGCEERFGDEYINAITGGVAVFLWHDDWLAKAPSRRLEVERTIEAIISDEAPEQNELRSEHDVSTWTSDCFVAESAAMLWARQPQNRRWLR